RLADVRAGPLQHDGGGHGRGSPDATPSRGVPFLLVIPAKAGIQRTGRANAGERSWSPRLLASRSTARAGGIFPWIPAFAGMTAEEPGTMEERPRNCIPLAPQNSIPAWAFTPSRKGCLIMVISVTRSAASISSSLALRPVITTW